MHIHVFTVRVCFVHNARQKSAISCFGRPHRPIRSFRFVCAGWRNAWIRNTNIVHIPLQHLFARRSAAARFITIECMRREEENMFAIQAEFIFSMERITNSYPTISQKRKLFGWFVWFLGLVFIVYQSAAPLKDCLRHKFQLNALAQMTCLKMRAVRVPTYGTLWAIQFSLVISRCRRRCNCQNEIHLWKSQSAWTWKHFKWKSTKKRALCLRLPLFLFIYRHRRRFDWHRDRVRTTLDVIKWLTLRFRLCE